MIRRLLVATAIAASALSTAAVAAADDQSGRYDTDVPGMSYDASLGAPCYSWDRFIFGRGRGGQAEACHYLVIGQWPPSQTGYWVISYPLYGVQTIGAPCPNPRGAAAQSPDGIALICTPSAGWQPG
jgi:hypothetical protein